MSNHKRTILDVAETIVNDVSIMMAYKAPDDHISKKIKTILDKTPNTEIIKLKNHFNESNAKLLEGFLLFP